MKYYRVNPMYAGAKVRKYNTRQGRYNTVYTLHKNELFTLSEIKKMLYGDTEIIDNGIPVTGNTFEIVYMKKSDTTKAPGYRTIKTSAAPAHYEIIETTFKHDTGKVYMTEKTNIIQYGGTIDENDIIETVMREKIENTFPYRITHYDIDAHWIEKSLNGYLYTTWFECARV